jgi:serine/threonine protein kinase
MPKNKFANWKVGINYSFDIYLGSGAYGEVASAIHLPTNRQVAIKVMRDVFEVPIDVKRAYREMHILRYHF